MNKAFNANREAMVTGKAERVRQYTTRIEDFPICIFMTVLSVQSKATMWV